MWKELHIMGSPYLCMDLYHFLPTNILFITLPNISCQINRAQEPYQWHRFLFVCFFWLLHNFQFSFLDDFVIQIMSSRETKSLCHKSQSFLLTITLEWQPYPESTFLVASADYRGTIGRKVYMKAGTLVCFAVIIKLSSGHFFHKSFARWQSAITWRSEQNVSCVETACLSGSNEHSFSHALVKLGLTDSGKQAEI